MAESRGSPGNSNVRLPNQVRGLSPIRITTMITTESVCLPEQVSFLVGSDIVGVEESGIAHHPASSSSSSNKEEEENNSNSGGDLCEDVISLGSQDTISDDSSTCGRDTKYTKHHKTLMRSVEPALSIFMFKNPTTFPAQLHQRAIPSISTSKTWAHSQSYPQIEVGRAGIRRAIERMRARPMARITGWAAIFFFLLFIYTAREEADKA